jgi:hypothetical protein
VKRVLAAAVALLLAACTTAASRQDTRPLYTRAALSHATTREIARLFLDTAAATIERHDIEDHNYLARDRSWASASSRATGRWEATSANAAPSCSISFR